MTLSWSEDDLFTVGASCSFREFIREPLKFQLRNSKVIVLRPFHWLGIWYCWLSSCGWMLDITWEGLFLVSCSCWIQVLFVASSRSICRAPAPPMGYRCSDWWPFCVLSVQWYMSRTANAEWSKQWTWNHCWFDGHSLCHYLFFLLSLGYQQISFPSWPTRSPCSS